MRFSPPILTPILGLATVLTLVGCNKNEDPVSTDAIIGDLSPELLTSLETPAEANAGVNITADFNSRMFFDDMGRALYTDRPSRLSPLPIGAIRGLPH